MRLYRGIGNMQQKPIDSAHFALYLTTDISVARYFGRGGRVFQVDTDELYLLETCYLGEALENSDYPELADDYSENNLADYPLLGDEEQGHSIIDNLGYDGVIDKFGNVELFEGDIEFTEIKEA